MAIIKSCPKCKSSNLTMKTRGNEKDIMKANMVELRCDSCGAWLKWVPKKERAIYLGKSIPKPNQPKAVTKPKQIKISEPIEKPQPKKENIFTGQKKFNFDKAMANSELRFERDAYMMKSEKLKAELAQANQRISELEAELDALKNKTKTKKSKKAVAND